MNSTQEKSVFGNDNCIRLRGHKGNYVSILPCSEQEDLFDLCLPNGKVLYCGVDKELVEVLIEHLGLENIEPEY